MSQSPSSVWNNCLLFIEDNIQPQAYNTWFKPIIPIKVTDKVLSIQVPSKFFYEWLEEHYIKILKLALTKELGKDARLVYVIKMENTFGNKAPYTEKIPSSNNSSLKSQNIDPLQVSRKQFTFYIEDGKYYIVDGTTSVQEKPSGNHTTVNGKDITEQGAIELNSGDKIGMSTVLDIIFRVS